MSEGQVGTFGAPPPPPRGQWRWVGYLAIVLVALAALGGAVVMLVFSLTAGPVKAADAFLQTLVGQGPSAAYAQAGPAFRAVAPEPQWEAFARGSGLATYKSASWNSRSIENDTAHLAGTVTTTTGATLPTEINLTKDASGWRVASLRLNGGIGGDAAPATSGLSTTGGGVTPQGAANPGLAVQPPQAVAPTAEGARPGYPSPGLDSVTAPPADPAMGAVLGARAVGEPARTAVPAAKVAGICMTMLQAERLPVTGVECLNGLDATPGSTTRCVVRVGVARVGMTTTLRSFDPASMHPTVMCVVDAEPMH